jgi:hypothetical protein
MDMKQILVMMVVLVGCSKDTPETSQAAETEAQATPVTDPVYPANEKLIADPIIEKAVRGALSKFKGKLTEADLAKVDLLDLQKTKITDSSLKDVAKLQKLELLGLWDTRITDEGLKEVVKLQNLKWLVLTETKLTDAGLKEVAKLQNLTSLGLGGTKVTKAGVAELKMALPNCSISGP